MSSEDDDNIEATQIVSQGDDIEFTGQLCTEIDNTQNLSQIETVQSDDVEYTGQACTQVADIDDTQEISQSLDIEFTGQPCSDIEDLENTQALSQGTGINFTGETCSEAQDFETTQVLSQSDIDLTGQPCSENVPVFSQSKDDDVHHVNSHVASQEQLFSQDDALENTEVVSQGNDIQFTGQPCSEDDALENTQTVSQENDIQFTGQPCSEDDAIENTQLVSQDNNILCTDHLCSESNMRNNKCPENDIEYSVSSSRPRTNPIEQALEIKSQSLNEGANFDPDETFLDDKYFEQKAKMSCESKDDDKYGIKSISCESSSDLTQPLNTSQDIQTNSPASELNDKSDQTKEHIVRKLKSSSLSNSSQTSSSLTLSSEVATSSSLSHGTSSSSSKKGESDDSEDIFASQGSLTSSQNNLLTVSQLVPTLQLSSDIQPPQIFRGYAPNRLSPSSPTSADTNGTTSTPLRQCKENLSLITPKSDLISISDEEISFEESRKLGDKRKLSDISSESKPDTRAKRQCLESRQSIEVVEEFNTKQNSVSISDSEDLCLDSQGIYLHLSLSQTDPELSDGQSTEISNTVPQVASGKSYSETSVNKDANMSSAMKLNQEHSHSSHDISIVQIDDLEEEVQFVSPPSKSKSVGEITLDSSGPQPFLSTSGDVEVLSPPCSADIPMLQKRGSDLATDKSKKANCVEFSPFGQKKENSSSSTNIPARITHVSSGLYSPSKKDVVVHDLDSSKENLEPDIQDFENKFILTYTCTYEVVTRTAIDMQKKETVSNSIPRIEVLQSRTTVKRDSSPSAVEESSPGSIASGPGPFTLPPLTRMSMYSTTSSSSAGSAASILHRQAYARRGPRYQGSVNSQHHGPIPWLDLIQQSGIQNELCASGADTIEKLVYSHINHSSSDDNKTVSDKALSTVVEDDEDVLGVPLKQGKKLPTKIGRKKKTNPTQIPPTNQNIEDVCNKEQSESSQSLPINKRRRGRPAKAVTPSKTPSKTPVGSGRKKAPTPAKKDYVSQSSLEPSRDESTISSDLDQLPPGCPVFALYDQFYYPAEIENMTKPNSYSVIFHDSAKKVLNRKQLFLISTFEIGQSLLAEVKSGDYREGEVTAVTPLVGQSDLYTVKLVESGEIITVPKSGLCLSEVQARRCVGEYPSSTASNSSSPHKRCSESKAIFFDLEKNYIPEKRNRTPKSLQFGVNSPSRPGPSNTARRLISDSSSAAEDGPMALALITGVQSEQTGIACVDPLARKGKGVKNSSSKKPLPDLIDEDILKAYGRIPPEGSKIFKGYSFLITKTDEINIVDERTDIESENAFTDSEACDSSSENFKFTHAPFSKDRLSRQILAGGGKVLKSWTEISAKDIKSTYVVSDRPCLTATYIHCLVRGIQSIPHDYIIDRCKNDEKFSVDLSVVLPAGFSKRIGRFIEWKDHKSTQPLKGQNVLVDDKNRTFKQFWEEILKCAGAEVVTIRRTKGELSSSTKIVSENPCSDSVLKLAQKLNIPVLSPVWVTQSLIHNSPQPVNGHKTFAYDFHD